MKKIILIMFVGIFLSSLAFAAEQSYCCEKTVDGAWCQNAIESECSGLRTSPTSCELTSYCRLGCCFSVKEGTCMENTPEVVCNERGGVWSADKNCAIPQCGLGCCLMGDQASFVTQTRCKRLSALYGLETNFRTDIRDELTCVLSVVSEVKGACVFEEEFQDTCKFITKRECDEMSDQGIETEFFENKLCSNPELNTCGPSRQTTCVEGKDEVYFLDSCGNLANVYDSRKLNDQAYWSEVVSGEEVCGYGESNADSQTCGNCDYFLGSTCQDYKNAQENTPSTKKPTEGDYICADLGCMWDDTRYEHGETWCESNANSNNLRFAPGARDFRLVCYNGEVTVEPCADYRNEICMSSKVNDFSNAMCRVNRWQDCASQGDSSNCLNRDKRDCNWANEKCVPLYPPGLNPESGEGAGICGMASETLTVKFVKGALGDEDCKENCQALSPSWVTQKNQFCVAIGDCGNTVNFLGISGRGGGYQKTFSAVPS